MATVLGLKKEGNICPHAAHGSSAWSTTVELPARKTVVTFGAGVISTAQTLGALLLNSSVSLSSQCRYANSRDFSFTLLFAERIRLSFTCTVNSAVANFAFAVSTFSTIN